jgi:outer membrane protein assembly factor BamB
MRTLATLTLVWLLAAASPAAEPAKAVLDNWPQWRGPLANGQAPKGDPPLKWDAKTNLKWKTALPGQGASTPIVWGDKVFVLTAIDTGKEAKAADIPKEDPNYSKRTTAPRTYHKFVVLCIDRAGGKVLWEQTAAERVPYEGHHPTHTYAAASPATDGKYLYVSFGSQGLHCYDFKGNRKWKRDLGRVHSRLGWGEGTSPVVHGDSLIMNWDHEGKSFILVLDARTGDTRWRKDRDEVSTWATPLVVEHKGKTQVIVNGKNRVRSYDLADGKVLWECGGQTVNPIPSPVVKGDVVYCMTGYRGSAAYAIPLESKGDITGTDKVLWHYSKGTPYVPSPLLAGDRLYFTQGLTATLTCLNIKTGKAVIDRERLPGLRTVYASPVAAKGRIYFLDRDGTTVVIKQADKLEVLATNRLDDVDEAFNASPAVVGKQLFLRGTKHLYCFEGQKK